MRTAAPSSKLLLSLTFAFAVFALPGTRVFFAIPIVVTAALLLPSAARQEFARDLLPKIARFVVLVFVIRTIFELVSPEARAAFSAQTVFDSALLGAFSATRLLCMLAAISMVIASSTAAQVIADLEAARATEQLRLYALVTLQYPKQLARRHRLIEEAQRSRGLDPGTRLVDRIRFNLSIVLPMVQSELDTIGDRAALIHSRGLDVVRPRTRTWAQTRTPGDWRALSLASLLVAAGIVLRVAA